VRNTDGVAVPPCEVRVVDRNGNMVVDEPGELQMRGPGLFVGYHDRPQYTTEAVDPEGWFRTGDVARMSTDNTLVLDGRIKDVVIRGGLNIPVRELEDLIYRHPAVEEVAIVGMPDDRLGERACAFVVLSEESSLSLAQLVAFLADQGLSNHYMPERLETVIEMPKTMSGKIRKVELRAVAVTLASRG
jgi:cyclohexanecarboxylate-CoA ligase